MKPLKPFFTLYGGKWRAARHYPKPRYQHICEPFAGAAGYSLHHYGCRVTLIERDPVIAATWRYLIEVRPSEIMALPDLVLGQTTDDLDVCEEARFLIGWWLKGGSNKPVKKPTGWMKKADRPGYKNGRAASWWGPNIRARIADQVECIRHWKLVEGDYQAALPMRQTWFIDPPYNNQAGAHYVHGARDINYEALAAFCRARWGQVIVCEQEGADWLDFCSFRAIRSATRRGARTSREVVWLHDA